MHVSIWCVCMCVCVSVHIVSSDTDKFSDSLTTIHEWMNELIETAKFWKRDINGVSQKAFQGCLLLNSLKKKEVL